MTSLQGGDIREGVQCLTFSFPNYSNTLVGESSTHLDPKVRIHRTEPRPIHAGHTAGLGTKSLLLQSTIIWGLFVTAAEPCLGDTQCGLGTETGK